MNIPVYEVSLLAAYIAGMVALFAPCCISYLFPAYLGNVFKEKRQVLLMTFIYSLGIFTVLLPVVMGAKALSSFFFTYHDQSYLIGGSLMIVVAFMSLLGIKMPMPHITTNRTGTDPLSTYILGIVSGITSACCAPVLLGVLTLSSLSPSLFQAIVVGALYVLGMVTPLYIAASLIHKRNILAKPILRKVLTTVSIGKTKFPIFVSNIISFGVFILTGWLLIILTLTGQLGMDTKSMAAAQSISNTAAKVTQFTDNFPILNLAFGLSILVLFITYLYVMKQSVKEEVKVPSCCRSHTDEA